MIEEIAFVRLIPLDLICWDRSDVQTIDVRTTNEPLNQVLIARDCRDYQTRSERVWKLRLSAPR